MAASADSIKRAMDLEVSSTGRMRMNIHIVIDDTPSRNAFVGGKADRPVGYGFAEHPAITAQAIAETVMCHVTELIKQADKLSRGGGEQIACTGMLPGPQG
jgi:hypothetical protein